MQAFPIRRSLVPAGLAAALISGCGATHGGGETGRGGVATTPAATEGTTAPRPGTVPAVPDGWQRISSLGLEVDVPGSWEVNSWSGCGASPHALVTRAPGAVAGCGSTREPRFTLVIERRQQGAADQRRRPGDQRTQLVVAPPGAAAVAVVTGPDASLVRRIAATVRPVEVDGAGCTTRLPADPAWDRPRPGPRITLAAPASVAVCLYEHDLLGASTVLTGSAAQAAVRTLTSAAPGPLPDHPQDCSDDLTEMSPLWLHVRTAAGRTTEVRIHFDGCRGRRVTTPGGVAHVTQAQLRALLDTLHTGYGFGGDVPEH